MVRADLNLREFASLVLVTRTLGLLLGMSGCAQLLEIPESARVIDTGPWRCLAGPTVAAPVQNGISVVQIEVEACNFLTNCQTDVTGLTADLCDKRDVGCLSPRVHGIVDMNGLLKFQVPTSPVGFDGYLAVTPRLASCGDTTAFGAAAGQPLCDSVSPGCDLKIAGDVRCLTPIYVPTLFFLNPPVVGPLAGPLQLQMFPTAALPAAVAAGGYGALDLTTGNLFLQAFDCDGAPASGVTFSVAEHANQVSPFYVTSGIISYSSVRTDSAGTGGFFRVPVGFVTITAYNDKSVAIGQIGVQTAPSTVTSVGIVPQR